MSQAEVANGEISCASQEDNQWWCEDKIEWGVRKWNHFTEWGGTENDLKARGRKNTLRIFWV